MIQSFTEDYLTQIPLLAAMKAKLDAFDGHHIRFSAPLSPNINDKGTGFAGSIASLCLISGWSLATLIAVDIGRTTETAIKNNQQKFLRPVRSDFYTLAQCTESDRQTFSQQLKKTGKGQLKVTVQLSDDCGLCATFEGEYVAKTVTRNS